MTLPHTKRTPFLATIPIGVLIGCGRLGWADSVPEWPQCSERGPRASQGLNGLRLSVVYISARAASAPVSGRLSGKSSLGFCSDKRCCSCSCSCATAVSELETRTRLSMPDARWPSRIAIGQRHYQSLGHSVGSLA